MGVGGPSNQSYITLEVEAKVVRDTDGWQVCFMDPKGTLIGIPLRGVTEAQAKKAVQSLCYAFEFGFRFYSECRPHFWLSVEPS